MEYRREPVGKSEKMENGKNENVQNVGERERERERERGRERETYLLLTARGCNRESRGERKRKSGGERKKESVGERKMREGY